MGLLRGCPRYISVFDGVYSAGIGNYDYRYHAERPVRAADGFLAGLNRGREYPIGK